MISFKSVKHLNKLVIATITALALYAPMKDFSNYISEQFATQNIEIVDASFGARMPWQQENASYVKVSQGMHPSFASPQIIYTRLRLTNPTSTPKTYRKIWLNFEHANGGREYTTDYTLYNADTRQRLIGESIQLGPNSSVEVIAAYRFIPSYGHEAPDTMSVSWEGNDLLRERACEYDLKTAMENNFHYQCKG